MNRFRFRGWNKFTRTMLDLKAITPLVVDETLMTDGVFLPFDDKVVLMQSTGLKDKNGKEIFEGDVVKHWHEELFFEDMVVGSIAWSEEDCGFRVEYESCAQLISGLDVDFAGFVVIGNIYENPELA